MSDPDFGRGDFDPLGGPTVANTPDEPDIWGVDLRFRVADAAYGVRQVHMTFTDPKGEAEELLLRLWRLWYADALARAKVAGTGDLLLG